MDRRRANSGWDSCRRPLCGSRSCLLHREIEHAHLLPVGLVFLDELHMTRMHLVGVVIGLGGKDDVQAHVEIAIVHGPLQGFFKRAAREEDRAGMAGQMVPASLHELGAAGGGRFLEGEVDVVSEKASGHRLNSPLGSVPSPRSQAELGNENGGRGRYYGARSVLLGG